MARLAKMNGSAAGVEERQAAAHRHVEHEQAEQQDDGDLHVAHQDERHHLAQHQAGAVDRGHDQLLQRALLALPHHRDAHDDDERHREQHADDARDDVDRALERGVEPAAAPPRAREAARVTAAGSSLLGARHAGLLRPRDRRRSTRAGPTHRRAPAPRRPGHASGRARRSGGMITAARALPATICARHLRAARGRLAPQREVVGVLQSPRSAPGSRSCATRRAPASAGSAPPSGSRTRTAAAGWPARPPSGPRVSRSRRICTNSLRSIGQKGEARSRSSRLTRPPPRAAGR